MFPGCRIELAPSLHPSRPRVRPRTASWCPSPFPGAELLVLATSHGMPQRRSVATLRAQSNFRSGWFQLTAQLFPVLFLELNSSFFVFLRETNRKCEPFCNPRGGIPVGIPVGISVAIFGFTFGGSSMWWQQTRTTVRGQEQNYILGMFFAPLGAIV